MEQRITDVTISWLAWLFAVPAESLNVSTRIGPELQPEVNSFYGRESFDVLLEDIRDVEKRLNRDPFRDQSTLTVGDVCALMEHLQKADPTACRRLLSSWQRIMTIDQKPKWRRLLFKLLGV